MLSKANIETFKFKLKTGVEVITIKIYTESTLKLELVRPETNAADRLDPQNKKVSVELCDSISFPLK